MADLWRGDVSDADLGSPQSERVTVNHERIRTGPAQRAKLMAYCFLRLKKRGDHFALEAVAKAKRSAAKKRRTAEKECVSPVGFPPGSVLATSVLLLDWFELQYVG